MKPPPLWLSIFGLSSVLVIILSFLIIFHLLPHRSGITSQDALRMVSDLPVVQKMISENKNINLVLEPSITNDVWTIHIFNNFPNHNATLAWYSVNKTTGVITDNLLMITITPFPNSTGQFCGGIAGKPCPAGFTCKLDGSYPDAGGNCVKSIVSPTEYPWKKSTCGNHICEPCESTCCNVPCQENVCPPPNCLGFCPQDCQISPTPIKSSVDLGCKLSGCSHEICQSANDEPVASNCIYKTEYACLKYAKCEIQSTNKCGWTYTDQYRSCLQTGPQL